MSEENEVKVEKVEEVKVEGKVVTPEPQGRIYERIPSNLSEESKARIQGWVPKEEFRGDPAKWIDAKSFIERGETIVPIMKERNERLEKDVREMRESFKEFSEFHRQTEDRAYKKALREIEQRKLTAVESADTVGYQKAELEREELEKAKPTPKVEKPVELPEMQEFRKTNSWYETDQELTAEADALGVAYSKQNIPYPKILEKVQTTMKVLHPERFTNVRRDNLSSVESVSSETGLPKKGNSHAYENLPGEAKKQCDKWVKSGLLTKEQYIQDYEWE